ncbi:MAG TPA: MerR family transcriptional regulator [Longimicrobiales bacterium]|nr:MerR family transcriptional regulator [Longimicrobiales bacterium]
MNEFTGAGTFPWEDDTAGAGDAPGSDDAAPGGDAPEAMPDTVAGPAPDAVTGGHDDAQPGPAKEAAGEPAPPTRRGEPGARPLVRKEYYSISEVADMVGLPAHVLRYWETQFPVLNPSKNRSGNRVYQRKEIRLILLVKQLLHGEKYTVEGARQKLDQLRRGGGLGAATSRAMDDQMIQTLREDLLALHDLLKPDAD